MINAFHTALGTPSGLAGRIGAGAALMIAAAGVEAAIGVKAERIALEAITSPLSSRI